MTITVAGLSAKNIEEIHIAIKEDEKESGGASFEGKTGAWFTGLLSKAAKGAAEVGVDVVSSTISKALGNYMGG